MNSLAGFFARELDPTDDGQSGQVYFYSGQKQATGNAVEKAGLSHGSLYGLQVAELNNLANSNNESNATNLGGDFQSAFSLVNLADVNDLTGVQLDAASEAAGVTSFLRPEDSAWSTLDSRRRDRYPGSSRSARLPLRRAGTPLLQLQLVAWL